MDIDKKLVSYNFTKGGNKKKYIVIHDTGNIAKGANAESHYKYFNACDRGASAHYFVDDKQILHIIEDINIAWHCGVKYGTALKPEVTNSNSIGIEICINADGNYSKAVSNAALLTAHIMKLYSIPLENVVRHYDASAKICPATMKENNWQKWTDFKKEVEKVFTADTVRFNFFETKTAHIEGYIQDGTTYVKARSLLESMGFKVGWDGASKTVLVNNK